MKAVILRKHGGPEVLEVVDLESPRPGPGQIVIRTKAMAVSKPDTLIRNGTYHWSPPLPANPGNELVGTVDAVGQDVADLEVGQSVLLSARELPTRGGCYSELIAVPAAAVHLLPPGVDPEQAVVLPSYLVAHAMLSGRGTTDRAKTIFVNGAAGAVGGAITELAKVRGLTVIGTVGSDEKAAHARSIGADHLINYRQESPLARVMELTADRGVDIAFDHVIGPGFIDCLRMLADFGTLIAYNVFSPLPDVDVFDQMRKMSSKTPTLRCFNIHTYDHDIPAMRVLMKELITLLADGKIRPKVGARLPMADAANAHRLLEEGKVVGKILLLP